jgi:putative RNA 2'-phosphotransferase
MSDLSLVRLSRFLSLVLRHNPGAIDLRLDAEGWAGVEDLLAAALSHKVDIDRNVLERIVAEDAKRRYSFSADGTKIKANYGHSIEVDLRLLAQDPPEILYHGTATANLDSIKRNGIKSGRRRYVHLSVDAATAAVVGKRHGKPAVLKIDARRMRATGFDFYHSEAGIWLTRTVPPAYIVFSDLSFMWEA